MADSFITFAPDVTEEESRYPAPFATERFGFTRNLGKAIGSKSVGLAMDRLPPGERSSMTHAHLSEEELVYVLEGACAVRIIEPGKEPREVELRAGHVVAFVAGTRVAHCFVNHSDKDCVLLTVGERKSDEKCFYAESGDREYDAFFAKQRPECYWAP